jgi:hypothetical protein
MGRLELATLYDVVGKVVKEHISFAGLGVLWLWQPPYALYIFQCAIVLRDVFSPLPNIAEPFFKRDTATPVQLINHDDAIQRGGFSFAP